MIMDTANIQFRMPAKEKKQLEKVLDDMGLDIATAMRMYARKILQVKTIPFRLGTEERDENGFTKKQRKELDAAIKEMNDPKAKRFGPFTNAEDAIKFLNSV